MSKVRDPREKHPSKNWIVLKFGGTSVASLSSWQTIRDLVHTTRREGRLLLVCSALAGVSNLIEELLSAALRQEHAKTLQAIEHRHQTLARDLGVDLTILKPHLDEMERLCRGIALVGEASPRIKALLYAQGELMSTRLGAAYLASQGIPTLWKDAREYLLAEQSRGHNPERQYLSASCGYAPDASLIARWGEMPDQVIMTQGFMARDERGETVLLGRGGSDISASYFAAKLEARRLEIWTDVPGMYTANPHQIPSAHLLTDLHYAEAQEMASSGAKVLHPRCLTPVQQAGIPLHIRSLKHPTMQAGTVISQEVQERGGQVKAISAKRGITIISMETIDMWQQVGFLARAFDCFQRHGLSVDLVSTSESNVTVTLDGSTNLLNQEILHALTDDLSVFCKPRVIESCALVSLVGRNISATLHRIGPALEVFEAQRIYLISQAANDLNMTFVVDEEQSERLVRGLHAQLIQGKGKRPDFGPTWRELSEGAPEEKGTRAVPWWHHRREELLGLARQGTPAYIYDEATIDGAISRITGLSAVDRAFYAMKANAHAEILRKVHDAGLGFECVSPGEIDRVCELFPDIDPTRILFTPNFAARWEYEKGFAQGVRVTLDNLDPLQRWPETFRGQELLIRIDPGQGAGHHKYVHTAGSKSKFGIAPNELAQVKELTVACEARVVGLHAHVGSNIFRPETWNEIAIFLSSLLDHFPEVQSLDLGGGFGVVERPGQEPLDLQALDAVLQSFKAAFPRCELWIEPGRFLVSESGVLLASFTQSKVKGDYAYVGLNAGMQTLIRPALYGSYHEIVNLTRLSETPALEASIVGPICESGDVLGYERLIARPEEGDIFLIATAGAYGQVMSSTYNLRPRAQEHFLRKASQR